MNQTIDSATFHRALLHGARRVEGKRDELNRINAFPVPDRDTGNNLAYLMGRLRSQLPAAEDYDDLLARLSEASLLGARGNSGAIFSQYFTGFHLAAAHADSPGGLPVQALGRMFERGYTHAYQAIQQPREGTILSAMRAFSDAFSQVIFSLGDLRAAADAALGRLKDTALATVHVLPEQRALNAPDAGAMGFFYFAEGFLRSLLGEAETFAGEDEPLPVYTLSVASEHLGQGELLYRYCSEAVVRLPDDAGLAPGLKHALEGMGDSMVLTQAGHLARVHLHTNEPARVVDLLAQAGQLLEVKADDMRMQQALTSRYPGETALVVDSIADVPQELLGSHAYVLPLTMLADGISYQDRRTISPERVKRLSGRLSSSQLNLQEVSRFLDPILRSYDRVLLLSVSSKMSGLYSRYEEYLRGIAPGRVRLVDSRLNSAAQGLLALHAARRLEEGAPLEKLAIELESLRARTHILVSLPDLGAMIASGRLNRRVGSALRAIGYLPLVTIDREGQGTVTGLSFSAAQSVKLLLKKVISSAPGEYAVVHFDNPDRAQSIAAAITRSTGVKPAYISDISAVVANFAGQGACAVAWVDQDPKEVRP